jgi:AraC-like DNA-binding protein
LAKEVNLTPSYLSTLFNKETGYTPMHYIQHKRIEAASNLLKYSDYKVADIAYYFSFNSQSHFITVFKKEKGMTPLNYRNRYFKSNWKE